MSSVAILLNRELGSHGGTKKNKFCCSVGNLLELAEDKAATYKLEEMPCNLPSSVKSTFLITFSHDGLKVASACGDHNVWVCDVRTGKPLKTLKGHPRTPWCLTFHPTSNDILASGCLGGEVRVWDLHGSSEVWVVEQKQPITSLTFHPTDKVLVIATLNQLHFWDWSLPAPFATCETNSDKEKVRYVKFDTQGTRLITGITNVPPEIQRSHESIFGSVNFQRSALSRSFSAQRTSILNRLMNLYSHLEGLEEISRYAGSSSSGSGSSGRSGALSPTQDDALQRARLFAEEVSIHNAHLYRQRLYNLDQALGLQTEPNDLFDDNNTSSSRIVPGRGTSGLGLSNASMSQSAESLSLPAERRSGDTVRSSPAVPEHLISTGPNSNPRENQPPPTASSSQESAIGSSTASGASGRSSLYGYGSVNADFWVTFHRLRFICSSLERRIHQQPPPSLFLDMPHLPSIPPEQFASNVPVPESTATTRSVLDQFLGPSTLSSSASPSQQSSSSSTSTGTHSLRNSGSTSRSASDARETGPSTPDVSVSLVSLLTRLQHSLQSLSNAALTTAVARDQIQQVRTRIAEILERLDNVSGYRARLTNLRDQIYEAADRMAQRGEDNTQTQRRDLAYCLWLVEMSLQLTRDMQRILATDYRLTQLHLNSSLPGTSLSNPSTSGTSLSNPSTSGTSLSNPSTSGTSLSNPLTSGTSLSNPSTSGTSLSNPSTSGTSLSNPSTSGTSLLNPSTSGTSLLNPSTSGTSLLNPSTSGTSLLNPSTSGTSFSNPSTSGTSLSNPSTSGTSLSNTPSSGTSLSNTPSSGTSESLSTQIPPANINLPQPMTNENNTGNTTPVNLESMLSSRLEPPPIINNESNTSNSFRTFNPRNYSFHPSHESSESVVRTSISERITSLLNMPPTSGIYLPSLNRTASDSSFSLSFNPDIPVVNSGDSSHSLAHLASERLPNHFNIHGPNPSSESAASQINFESSPFFWRNQALRRRPQSTDNVESRPTVILPTVPSLSSTVGLLIESGLGPASTLPEYNIYQPGLSRSSPFEVPNRRVNLNVNSEHPPMNDASTSTTGRVSLRLSNQGTGATSNPVSQCRSASRPGDRYQSSLGRGMSSRIITSAVRPTRTAVARRRWLNYRMNMSPTSLRRRRLYRWSSQQPLATSGGTQLVVNPRHNRQNYSDAGTSEVSHDQHLPRSVNRSSTTSDGLYTSMGIRISRRIRSPSSPSTSGLGQPGVVESEILLNRLRTVQRERLAQPFTIPFVQIERTNSPPDGDLPPLPLDQRPRSPPLSTILSRSGANASNNGPGIAYLGVASPRLGPATSYWSHFYDTGIRSRGMAGGFDSSHNLTYRIQCWDFSSYVLPNIAQSESCIVVPKCKINNDGSIDISKDGKFLAAFVPNIGNMRQSTMVAVYSLAPQNIGQCLYTWNFENTSAMSVSFSPLARYLVIGIGTHRHHLTPSEREPLAQIFRLDPFTKNSSLTFVSSVYQEGCNNTNNGTGRGIASLVGAPALNFVRWLPESGQGLIYGTNRGSLLICRPVSSNSDSHYVSPYHLVSTSTQTVDQESSSSPEMQTTGTQTASTIQQTNSDDDDDDEDEDDDE